MKWNKTQLMAIEQQQLVELWSTYGNSGHGGHTEVDYDSLCPAHQTNDRPQTTDHRPQTIDHRP